MANPRNTVWGDTMSSDGENRRLYIGNIPKSCTLQDLEDKFAKYGCIEGISIKAGFAFLQYKRPNEAMQAVLEDRTKLLGSTLSVRAYRSDKPPPGEKSKSIKKDRSRSPPASRRSAGYDDWPKPMSNEVPALGPIQGTFNQTDSIGNEVEVIVYEPNPDATQKHYAEVIESRVKNETNISTVDIIYRRTTDELTDLLNDLYIKKTLYAILISPLDPVNLCATLYLIRDTTAPKYTNLDELIQFVKEDYQSTYRGKPPSFRYEQFSRPDGFFAPPLLTPPSSQYFTRYPTSNMQARLGGYKVEEPVQSFSTQPAAIQAVATQHVKAESKPNLVINLPQPSNPVPQQRTVPVKIKDEKMPKDVELSLRLILEQGHCRSLSDIQLESIVDYLKSQKVANGHYQSQTTDRLKLEEKKPNIKNIATSATPVTNAFSILAKSGMSNNSNSFSDSARLEQVHIKEEQGDEPLIIQEKIANKSHQSSNNQTKNSTNINSVLDSAFDVLQKSGISVRNANVKTAGLLSNSNFQRRHPLNGTQIYPDQSQGSSFSGRF